MRKIELFDKDSVKVNSTVFRVINFFNLAEKHIEIDSNNHPEFSEVVEYGVDMFKPSNDSADNFFILDLGDTLLNLFGGNKNLLLGRFFDEACPILDKLGYSDILREVYLTGKSQKFKANYYINDKLQGVFIHTFIKFEGHVLLFTKSEGELDLLVQQEEDLFNNAMEGILILKENKIARVNPAFCDLVGFSEEEIIGHDFHMQGVYNKAICPDGCEKILTQILNREKFSYDGEFKQKTKNGDYIWFKAHLIPINYKNTPAVQVTCVDITETKKEHEAALNFRKALSMVEGVSKIAFVHWDSDNHFLWSDEIYNIVGDDKEENDSEVDILSEHIIKEDRKKLFNARNKSAIDLDSFVLKSQVLTHSGDFKDVLIHGNFVDSENHDQEMFGYVQDITESLNNERELKKLLEEKDYLIKEVNHRVKNNLQIILSLLNLDLRRNPYDYEKTINATQNRIKAMAFIHEKTYASADLDHVNLKEYIDTEVTSLLDFYDAHDIKPHLDLVDVELTMEIATPLSLAINEVIINVIKYAFPEGNGGNLYISIKEENGFVTLILGDDGVGLPDNVDIYNSPSLGLNIINSLVSQVQGTFNQVEADGTMYEIKFKNSD